MQTWRLMPSVSRDLTLIAFVMLSVWTISAFAIDYPDPTPTYCVIPFLTPAGPANASFQGNGAFVRSGWPTVKQTIVRNIKTKASPDNPDCFVAYVDSPPTFSFSAQIQLPKVNTWYNNSPAGVYWIYQDFVDDMTEHEYWHYTIHKAYANGPWAALEAWLSTYQSSPCTTSATAIANAKTDINAAFAKVEATENTYATAAKLQHPAENDCQANRPDANHSKPYYRANNPNWGLRLITQ